MIDIMYNSSQERMKLIFLFSLILGIIFLLIFYSILKNREAAVLPSAVTKIKPGDNKKYIKNVNFAQAKVQVSFKYDYDIPVQKDEKGTYVLDESNMQRVYKVSYFPTKEEFIAKAVYKNDQNNGKNGRGCFYDESKNIVINNQYFHELVCYQNRLDIKTGDYIQDKSIVIATHCVYELPEGQGVVYFHGQLPLESNVCDILKEKFHNLTIINQTP
jgi:hypothetical protein